MKCEETYAVCKKDRRRFIKGLDVLLKKLDLDNMRITIVIEEVKQDTLVCSTTSNYCAGV